MNQREQENEMIRRKLEALDSLPEGYNPSMQSKWELLEAGLPQPKTAKVSFFYRWVGVAAAVLLVMGLFWVSLSPSVPPVADVAPAVQPEKPKTSLQPTQERVMATPEEPRPATKALPKLKLKKPAVGQPTEQGTIAHTAVIAPETNEVVLPDTLPVVTERIAATPETPQKRRPKPKRFTEIDFNEGDTTRTSVQPFAVAKEGSSTQFRVRISSSKESHTETSESPIKLKYPL